MSAQTFSGMLPLVGAFGFWGAKAVTRKDPFIPDAHDWAYGDAVRLYAGAGSMAGTSTMNQLTGSGVTFFPLLKVPVATNWAEPDGLGGLILMDCKIGVLPPPQLIRKISTRTVPNRREVRMFYTC